MTTAYSVALARLHDAFLALVVPKVVSHGRVYFRHLRSAELKEEYIAEMVALTWKWHCRLAERGKDSTRFPSALASFAARAVRSGRRLAGMDRAKDVLSPLAQQRTGFAVGKLPDCSALRLDLPRWLATLGTRDRRIALDLALGFRTRELAATYRLSAARISQLRRRFHRSWRQFQGEPPAPARRAGGGVA